jgi:hemerythrin
MAPIVWNDSLSVGVAEIDRQHKKLIAMINELDNAMTAGRGKDVMGEIVDGLIIYTATHFRTEEKYFAQFEYRDAEIHRKEHADFIGKVAEFNAEIGRASCRERVYSIV